MKRLFLGIVLLAFGANAFGQEVKNEKEPFYNSDQLDWFYNYAHYNRELDLIVHEFVDDVRERMGVELIEEDIHVMRFDYKLLDVAWGEEVSKYILGMALGMYNDDEVFVVINEDKMRGLNFAQLKSTIYHELMHDIFNYEHHHEDGFLMSKSISSKEKDINYVENVIDEAFEILIRGEHQDHEEPIEVVNEIEPKGIE